MSAIDEIYEALEEVIPELTLSDGTLEKKIVDVVATYADTETLERENALNVINEALANNHPAGKMYYRLVATKFQIGDMLKYDPVNQGAYYDPVIEQNQIVKQAYIAGVFPLYTLLVNAVGSDGHLRPLDSNELASFITYFEEFQPLGMDINVTSMEVAQISDPGMVVYVRAGTDSGAAADAINANLLAYESVLRPNNRVSLTEITDVIQQYPGVVAVGYDNPVAREQKLDTTYRETYPSKGVFELTNGAFTFTTEITTDLIQVLG